MKMGEGYSYSKELVYNNFPWPENPTKDQITNIEKTAAEILRVRESLSSLTLKQMYGKIIPPELLKAHMENDKAVLRAYGFIKQMCIRDRPLTLRSHLQRNIRIPSGVTATMT